MIDDDLRSSRYALSIRTRGGAELSPTREADGIEKRTVGILRASIGPLRLRDDERRLARLLSRLARDSRGPAVFNPSNVLTRIDRVPKGIRKIRHGRGGREGKREQASVLIRVARLSVIRRLDGLAGPDRISGVTLLSPATNVIRHYPLLASRAVSRGD